MSYSHTAMSITPPVSGSDNLVVLASSATAATFKIPAAWIHGWITIQADGCDVYCAFTKSSTLAADGTDVTTLSGGAISAHGAAECIKVPDGTSAHFNLDELPQVAGDAAWYLAHVESAGSAYLRITKSSGRA